jgi:hydrogenase maturation protease
MNEWEWNALEDRQAIDTVRVAGVDLKPGDRVRLQPRAGGDVLDLALTGQIAVIEAIEQDYESHCHLAVVLDDDPGRDLGMARQPGHRFFFEPSEVVPIASDVAPASAPSTDTTVLIAGIGNIFFGDDGFGVEVAQRLLQRPLPVQVRVVDFGIRGFDLACALETADVTVLVDAYPHGAAPGTLKVIEPTLNQPALTTVEPHGLDPVSVLQLARAMNITPGRLFLVGCQPETLGGEDGAMGLSAPVTDAVDEAIALIDRLVADLIRSDLTR